MIQFGDSLIETSVCRLLPDLIFSELFKTKKASFYLLSEVEGKKRSYYMHKTM